MLVCREVPSFLSHFKTPSIGPALVTALQLSILPTVLSAVHLFKGLRLLLMSKISFIF